MSDHVKAIRGVTLAMADGIHRTLEVGEPVAVEDLASHLRDRLADGDEYLSKLLEPATKAEYDQFLAGVLAATPPKDFSRERLMEMENVVLPGPDQEAVIRDGQLLVQDLEDAGLLQRPIHHTSSAVTVEGQEADEELNATVGTTVDPEDPDLEPYDHDVEVEDEIPTSDTVEETGDEETGDDAEADAEATETDETETDD